MLSKEIEIDGKMIPFRASATIPRLYRAYFGRDIFRDMVNLQKAAERAENDGKEYQIDNLEMFENVAFIMAKHADPNIPNNPDEWLEQFNMFSIYTILPQILELWKLNNMRDVESKKKLKTVSGK